MWMRSFELVFVPGKKSRLTVTPTRVTVKVSQANAELASVLADAGRKIADRINLDRSMRGGYDLLKERVFLQTERGDVRMTFLFDGTLVNEEA